MIVFYVVHEFPARTQTFVEREIAAVRRGGLTVVVFSLHNRNRARLEHRVPLRWSECSRVVRGLLISAWRARGALIAVLCLPPRGWRNSMRQGFALVKAISLAFHIRLCVEAGHRVAVHAHFVGRTLDVLSLAAILEPRVRTSATAHAADASNPASPSRLTFLTGLLASRVAASESVSTALERETGRRADEVIHCGVSLPSNPAAEILKGPVVRVLSVGRFVEKKGFDDCLAAARLLHVSGVPFRWDFVGNGPLWASLSAEYDDLVRAGVVSFQGYRSNTAILDTMNSCVDVFVLASKAASDGDVDGIPVVLMEAMSFGIPVISTRVSGIPELISPGDGILVTPGRPGEIARNITLAVAHPYLYRQLGANGRLKVSREFSSDGEAAKMIKLFRRA